MEPSLIEDPDPIEVKGGYQSDNPPVPTQVNMMRVICHPDKMDIVKPQVAECVAGYAAYAQSLPTTTLAGALMTARPLIFSRGLDVGLGHWNSMA